jgi:putative phage-type endonuclease
MAIEILADLTDLKSEDPEYQALRKLGIGGSDAGAICGVSRFRTPYQVWSEKVNPSATAREESESMRWGKILEEPIRLEFEERTGIEVHPLPKMIRNVEHPWMLASVDGVTGPTTKLTGVYEGKTTRYADAWAPDDSGAVTVPLEYLIQGMHYLAVLGLEVLHYACLIGGQQLVVAEVARNESVIADLLEIEAAFWQAVTNREPPPALAADIPTLRKRWQPLEGSTIELTGTFATTLKVRAGYKAAVKDYEEKIDAIDAELMAFMGDNETATWQGKPVITWKRDRQGKLKGKELEAAHPDLVAQFRGEPGRRFLPKTLTNDQQSDGDVPFGAFPSDEEAQ